MQKSGWTLMTMIWRRLLRNDTYMLKGFSNSVTRGIFPRCNGTGVEKKKNRPNEILRPPKVDSVIQEESEAVDDAHRRGLVCDYTMLFKAINVPCNELALGATREVLLLLFANNNAMPEARQLCRRRCGPEWSRQRPRVGGGDVAARQAARL